MDRRTFDRVVGSLLEARSEGLVMRNLVVSSPSGTFVYEVTDGRAATDVRSISKVVVTLAVGAAIADGTRLGGRALSLDLEIWPFFAEYLDRQTATGRANLRAVRLRHLLTNTIGHSEGFLFRADLQGCDRDALLDHIFDHDLVHAPGSHFAYSNVGWYLLSAMVTDALGVSLSDWASDLVLRKLGITDVEWVTYGRYDAGGTGLALSAADLHTVGRLFLDGGRHRGRQIVPRTWIEAVRSPAVRASRIDGPGGVLRATSYGYGMWICDSGIHYCDGTGGQFLIVAPASRTVVVTVAEAGDTHTVARCLQGALRTSA
jgi:CubicO group peptidase (beta-lactamase class C family)